MLFGYPPGANADNWLHRCIICMVSRIHGDIQGGISPPDWPAIIPDAFRGLIESRSSIQEGIEVYRKAFDKLSGKEQSQVHHCMLQQNRISQLLSGKTNCETLKQLPAGIQKPALDLFVCGFEQLSQVETIVGKSKLRDQHHKVIFNYIEDKVCPFCGLVKMYPTGAPREAYDHYLLRTLYPFIGANLWNLVPMCHSCNSVHKRTADILWNGSVRRTAFNPYRHGEIRVSLTQSLPFGGSKKNLPKWQIDFLPNSPEVDTWDQVFCIRKRYCEYVLDLDYFKWLEMFAQFCIQRSPIPDEAHGFVSALNAYIPILRKLGRNNHAFLIAAVAEMLLEQCLQNNMKVIRRLKTSVEVLLKSRSQIR